MFEPSPEYASRELLAQIPLIRRLARSFAARCGRASDAEDIAHEVFLALLEIERRGLPLARVDEPSAYLSAIVRNTLRRSLRRQSRFGELVGDAADDPPAPRSARHDPEQSVAAAEYARARLSRLHSVLRPRDRQAMDLLVRHELDVRGVAKALGVTENHVYQMRHRIATAASAL